MTDDLRLLDFDWIAGELERTDIYTLLEQYENPPEDLPQPAVTLVQDALRLSAAALENDKTLLPSQLLGRLVYWDSDEWGDLPQQIAAWDEYDWLQPLQPMLTPAGGALLMTLKAHQEFILYAVFRAGRQELITIGNRDPAIRIWNLHNGCLLHEIGSGEAGVTAISFGISRGVKQYIRSPGMIAAPVHCSF